MERLSKENINTPEYFDDGFESEMKHYGNLKYMDLDRFSLMTKKFNGGRFLDLGVGTSPVVLELRKKFIDISDTKYWVLDFSPKTIEFWRRNFPYIQSVLADSCFTPFRDGYFDYIIAGELLEHIENVEYQIKEIFRILKKGGIFAFSTPLEETPQKRVSIEHIWSFSELDMRYLFSHYGELELTTFARPIPKIIGFCKKIGDKYAT